MRNPEFLETFASRYRTVFDHLFYGSYSQWDGWRENVLDQISKQEAILFEHIFDDQQSLRFRDKTIAILGGGFGFFSVPLFIDAGATHVDLYDMCPLTEELSWHLNGHYQNFTHHQLDVVFNKKYISEHDVYVNTSVEHMYHMRDIVPQGKYQVMACDTVKKRGHINRCDYQQLIASTAMSRIHHVHYKMPSTNEDRSGEINLIMGCSCLEYDR